MRDIKIVEHEPEIVTTYGIFKQKDAAKAIADREKARKEHFEQIRQEQDSLPKLKDCPFRQGSMSVLCQRNCAMYHEGRCGFASGERSNDGGKCPFSSSFKCGPHCAVYSDGCTLTKKG